MSRKKTQKGSALVYILIAIALLAALTATFMDSSSQQTSSQNTFNTVTELNSQINFIRSAIQECVLTYPAGDTTPGFAATGAINVAYPLNPTSSYLADPQAASRVEFIGCPGNPGDSNDHARIFGGSSGKFLPPHPKLFSAWFYQNNIDGVWIEIATDKTDPYIATALAKLDEQFSECEADVVDARGGSQPLVSDFSDECTVGHQCFRVRLIANPSAVYNGDSDGDEWDCP